MAFYISRRIHDEDMLLSFGFSTVNEKRAHTLFLGRIPMNFVEKYAKLKKFFEAADKKEIYINSLLYRNIEKTLELYNKATHTVYELKSFNEMYDIIIEELNRYKPWGLPRGMSRH